MVVGPAELELELQVPEPLRQGVGALRDLLGDTALALLNGQVE